MVLALDLNPCAVASSLVKPIRRRAEFRAFSESIFSADRIDGNTNLPAPLMILTSNKTLIACRDNGTSCGRRIFIRSSGMCQTLLPRSNSPHSAFRSSTGRGKVSASNLKACRNVGQPSYSSIHRNKPPNGRLSTSAALCLTLGGLSAFLIACVGSNLAL
jgi:hypothetical protein